MQRYQNWQQQQQQLQQMSNNAPCGMYQRKPANCYGTMPYIPWVHGDR